MFKNRYKKVKIPYDKKVEKEHRNWGENLYSYRKNNPFLNCRKFCQTWSILKEQKR
jgi:hypothetical protein